MTTKRNPKWKEFENLVADIQKAISPEAQFLTNQRVMGKCTGRKRQIDILIRQAIGQFELLIAIDCKDYKHPVDVKEVESFIGLIEDIMANKGCMVSAKGFTETAKQRAISSGIDLFRLVDAQNQNWRSYVVVPVVCDFRSIESWRGKIDSDIVALSWLEHQYPATIPLYDSNNSQIGSVQSVLWSMWNSEDIPIDPGLYENLRSNNPETFIQIHKGDFHPVKILFDIKVVQKLYFGYLPLTQIQGLSDEIKGGIVLPRKAEIVTDWIYSDEVEQNWHIIPTLESLAITPVMILKACDHYPVEDPFRI